MSKFQAYPAYKDSGVEWLGKVPEHWGVVKNKYLASFTKGRNPTVLYDEKHSGMEPYLSMDYLRGRVVAKYSLPESSLYLVSNNQPLIIWDGSNSGEFIKGKKGFLSSTMAAISLNEGVNSDFYWYLCLAIEEEMRRHAIGMGIPHVNGDELKGIKLPMPLSIEQTQIARFLDHETARMDALIAEQECLIELLKEKRQAVISHAVTKGLNPNVPMKDSGVEWLGEVPEHWKVVELKRYSSVQGGFAFPSNEFSESGIPVIRIGDIGRDGSISIEQAKKTNRLDPRLSQFVVRNGDLLMAMTGATIGKAGWYKHITPSYLNQRVGLFKTIKQHLILEFLFYIIQSTAYQEHIHLVSTGGAQPNISETGMLSFVLTLPDLIEQAQIVSFLDQETTKLDALITEAQHAITLIKERRSALISAAVTGKIDVRNWQPEAEQKTA